MELQSVVLKRKGKTRRGKGFSRDELREAGTDPKEALRSGIPVDLRRKTKHKENVKILKQYLRSLSSRKASKSHAN